MITQQRTELLNLVIENAPLVLFVLDADGIFTLSEGMGLASLGLDAGQIVGRSVFEVYAEVPRILEDASRALAGEEVRSVTKVGDVVFDAKYIPVLDDDGKVVSVTGVATEITDAAKMQAELRLRERAIDASQYGITIADARLPDMPLIYVNSGFLEMTGYKAEEVIGYNCRFLQGEERDQPQIDVLREAIQERHPTTVILRNHRKDGTPFWNELHISPIFDTDGRLTHFVGLQTDVTEREEAEQRIQEQNQALIRANRDLALARKKAEESTRLKSQFLATMSHELRTPLNAIVGYTEIQLAGMTGELTEEQQDYQERIIVNAKNLLELINGLLDLSKIEAGRLDIINKSFDLREWMTEMDRQVRGLAEEKGLEFSVTIDDRLPQQIVGDPERIKQIVLNLLSNAIKFTWEGFVRVEIWRHGRDAWKISVVDSGVGIPPHMQETIFDEFRQVDSSNQREYGGSGLGLAIVRKLALMMGGNVRLSSKVGEGSTFTLFLPMLNQRDLTNND